jgi:hypothetical protein
MYGRPSSSRRTLRMSLAIRHVSRALSTARRSVSDRSSSSSKIARWVRVGEYAASSRIRHSASSSVRARICSSRMSLRPPANPRPVLTVRRTDFAATGNWTRGSRSSLALRKECLWRSLRTWGLSQKPLAWREGVEDALERDPCPTAKRRRGLRCQRPTLSVRLRLPGLRCLCHSDGITPAFQKEIRPTR